MKTYNAITFTGNKELGAQGYVKYRKITNIQKFIDFINKKYPQWVFMNVYDKETNDKVCIKKNRLPFTADGNFHFFPAAKLKT